MIERWRDQPISEWYRAFNEPAFIRRSHRVYFEVAAIGDAAETPGAAWVGAWYARNLRIHRRLTELTRPDDRVLLLYGAGHAYLLDQFARESEAFDVADTLAHLPPTQP